MNQDFEALEKLRNQVGPGWTYDSVDHLVPQYGGHRKVVEVWPTSLDSVDDQGYSYTLIWPKNGRLFDVQGNEVCYFSGYGSEIVPSVTIKFIPPEEDK